MWDSLDFPLSFDRKVAGPQAGLHRGENITLLSNNYMYIPGELRVTLYLKQLEHSQLTVRC